MAVIELEHDWDIEDGELIAYVTHPLTGEELSVLSLDMHTLGESFDEDLKEAHATGDESSLSDWRTLADRLYALSISIKFTLDREYP